MSKRKRSSSEEEPRAAKKAKVDNKTCPIALHKLDLKDDVVTLINKTTKEVSLSGWSLKSQSGGQEYKFPDDAKLKPGCTLSVWSGAKNSNKAKGGKSSLFWTKAYVWKDSGDACVLYNAEGDAVDEVEVTKEREPPSVAIQKLDADRQCISIINRGGADVDIGGYFIRTMKLHTFTFPENTVLKAGDVTTVWSGAKHKAKEVPPASFCWKAHSGWTDTDVAVLYDNHCVMVHTVTEMIHLGELTERNVRPKYTTEPGEYPECTIL